MSMEFGFAVVPFKEDGGIWDLYTEESDFKEPKPGVTFPELINGEILSKGLNIAGITSINNQTDGLFFELTDGVDNGYRYRLLEPHRELLRVLSYAAARMNGELERRLLETITKNADQLLEKYSDQAAILIY